MRVLIVDDDHMICRCLQQKINWERIGCEKPVVAYNGLRAMHVIAESVPDIVISDVRMPVMDGKDLCKKIKESYPDIEILFLSGYEDFETARIALQYNARGYVLKPLDEKGLENLEKKLGEIVRLKENAVFCRKIVSNEYQDFLEQIIRDKNAESLERFFHKLEELEKDPMMHSLNIWANMLRPLFAYRYDYLNLEARILYHEERRMNEEILQLTFGRKIAYLREQYSALIKGAAEQSDSNIIALVQKAIQENFAMPDLNINMLGNMFSMSPAYLGRVFIEQTGMKIIDYIAEIRLQYACEQLQSSNRRIKEIAETSGYLDANYFTKVFLRKKQMTPMEYRQKYSHSESRCFEKELKEYEKNC